MFWILILFNSIKLYFNLDMNYSNVIKSQLSCALLGLLPQLNLIKGQSTTVTQRSTKVLKQMQRHPE